MKPALVTILCLFFLSSFDESFADNDWNQFCGAECARRCSVASAQERCLKYCRICCGKCHCVPSGTFGHRDECPCYGDWKNKKGGQKCP